MISDQRYIMSRYSCFGGLKTLSMPWFGSMSIGASHITMLSGTS